MSRHLRTATLVLLCGLTANVEAVIISEIHYHPPAGDGDIEFVELTNNAPSPVDLSLHAFVEGIRFTIPQGTVLRSGESLVVCQDVNALRARYGIENAIGDFEGRLDSAGERLTLVNDVGVVVETLRYSERGKWPVGPDGSGHTLVLKSIQADSSEPESWTQSPELGGSPGRVNFADGARDTTPSPIVFNELFRGDTEGTGWIELYNNSDGEFDVSGFFLTDDPQRDAVHLFSANSRIPPRGFVVVDSPVLRLFENELKLFLIDTRGLVVAASAFDRLPSEGVDPGSYSEARYPDGGPAGWLTLTPTRGSANEVARTEDIVINEIFYHPPERRMGEFLELYHRGSEPVDLSGFRFTKGIDYTFPDGTRLEAGGYRVVARLPEEIESRYGLTGVLGPYEGSLANGGENLRLVDLLGNLVDEVRYHDGGRWSAWADAGGSSLELIDPRQDNDFASAWAASDESDKAEWQEHFFEVPEYRRADESELHLLLVESGVCLVDDVSIIGEDTVETPIIDSGDTWRVKKGTEAFSDPGEAWREALFDDSGWEEGSAFFSMAPEDGVGTVLADMQGNYTSIALRKTFTVLAEALEDSNGSFILSINYDDGFCAYLNGEEIARENCPDPITHDAVATASVVATTESLTEIPATRLRSGENLLAIVAYNRSLTNRDFRIAPRLFLETRVERGQNRIPDPGFENGLGAWLTDGTHVETRVTTSVSHTGSAALELIASGKGDSRCGRVEIDTEPGLEDGARYEMSLWTRWQRGASLLVVHGEFSPGLSGLSNNPLGRRIRLNVPGKLGTPGARNSVWTDNIGPVVADVLHSPSVPRSDEAVRIEAHASDADGIASLRVHYKLDGSTEAFEATELFDDGAHEDHQAGDGFFAGAIPAGFASGTQILFYLKATDTIGATRFFPQDAPARTLLLRVQDGSVPTTAEVLLPSANAELLDARSPESNHLLDATFIYGGRVHYNAGLRYRGSFATRHTKRGYRVRFPEDDRFQSRKRDLNFKLDRPIPVVSHYIVGRSGDTESRVPVPDYDFIDLRIRGTQPVQAVAFDTVNRDFIRSWFGDTAATSGVTLKAVGRLQFSDICANRGWDPASSNYRGAGSEDYRFVYYHSLNQSRDLWQPWIDVTRTLDVDETSEVELDASIREHIDIEQFSRALAARMMVDDFDAVFIGIGHNGYVSWDETDGLWRHLPHDMDGVFGGGAEMFGFGDPNIRRLFERPQFRRSYLRAFYEISHGYWSGSHVEPYLDALEEENGFGGHLVFAIDARGEAMRTRMMEYSDLAFRILTNDGEDFEAEADEVVLEGEAPVQITDFLLSTNGGAAVPLEMGWTTPTRWRIPLSLSGGEQQFQILGFNRRGELLGEVSIRISGGSSAEFLRGDVNGDLDVNLGDARSILNHVFRGLTIVCEDAADANDDGTVNIADASRLLNFMFLRGAPPGVPFPDAGVDPTADDLTCGS